jgi:hypothetical protein
VPLGACCDPCDTTCTPNLSQAACQAQGGIWQGACVLCADVECPPVGACCLPSGACVDNLTLDECVAQGGDFKGECTSCDTVICPGACCLCDGSCTDGLTLEQCTAMQGIWQGLNTVCSSVTCDPVGACCLPDGSCTDGITQFCCETYEFGDYQGDGTTCATIPPCVEQCDDGCDHKGSLFWFHKVEVRWDASGNLIQDTMLHLTNDHPQGVWVQMFFVNGDEPLEAEDAERAHPGWNFVDNKIFLTGNQPIWWKASDGEPRGLSPWTVLDPTPNGGLPGRPAMDGTDERVLRGFIVGWAVTAGENHEIRWNHLAGKATLIYYAGGAKAWDYNTCAFSALGVENGAELPDPGTLRMDGSEYCPGPNQLLLNFQAVGSSAFSSASSLVISDTDITLHTLDADFRMDEPGVLPPATRAKYTVWNENEVQFSGAGRCITCWDQTLLSYYGVPNHFLLGNLQTDYGNARIDGVASATCPNSVDRAIVGLWATHMEFMAAGLTEVGDIAAAGDQMHWMGTQFGRIEHAAINDLPEESPENSVVDPFSAADSYIEVLRGTLGVADAAGR